uniref:Protein kinase domain-containing protein n=1 Tax=viral metagenome TaxID=1070528 RepID=A0A6C0C0W1_9ZZZZ
MKQKGGFGLKNNWKEIVGAPRKTTPQKKNNLMKEILYDYFFPNSTFKMFTNDSISCITYLVTLNDGKKSPFESMRTTQFNIEIRTLLLKIFVTTNNNVTYPDDFLNLPDRPVHKGIEITTKSSFNNEINIQKDVYQASLRNESSYLEPMCPAILYHDFTTSHDEHNTYWYKKLNSKYFEILDKVNSKNVPIPYWPKHLHIGFIAMEYMDGYQTLGKLTKNPNYNQYLIYAKYEIMRLNKLGFKHNDAHLGNIMINPNINYYSTNKYKKGKALIIDFGRSAYQGNTVNAMERVFTEEPHDEGLRIFKNQMNTPLSNNLYKKMYQKRLNYSNLFINHINNNLTLNLHQLISRFFGGRAARDTATATNIISMSFIPKNAKIDTVSKVNSIEQSPKMNKDEAQFLTELEEDDDSEENILNTIYGNFFNEMNKGNIGENKNRFQRLLTDMINIKSKGWFTLGGTKKNKKTKKSNKTEKKKK